MNTWRPKPPPPDETRCRATTKGDKIRGEYWSPPKRCGNYAVADGYCGHHRPPEVQETDRAPDPSRES